MQSHRKPKGLAERLTTRLDYRELEKRSWFSGMASGWLCCRLQQPSAAVSGCSEAEATLTLPRVSFVPPSLARALLRLFGLGFHVEPPPRAAVLFSCLPSAQDFVSELPSDRRQEPPSSASQSSLPACLRGAL